MLIRNKIEEIVKGKGLRMDFVYTSIGMTKSGFYKMMKDDTFKVDTLKKIAGVLNVPLVNLFPDDFSTLDLLYSTPYYGDEMSLKERVARASNSMEEVMSILKEYVSDRELYEKRLDEIIEKSKDQKYKKSNLVDDIQKLKVDIYAQSLGRGITKKV